MVEHLLFEELPMGEILLSGVSINENGAILRINNLDYVFCRERMKDNSFSLDPFIADKQTTVERFDPIIMNAIYHEAEDGSFYILNDPDTEDTIVAVGTAISNDLETKFMAEFYTREL